MNKIQKKEKIKKEPKENGIKQKLSSFTQKLTKILYPNNIKCLICGDDLPNKRDIEFCDRCQKLLEPIDETKCCLRCGAKLVAEEKYCLNCQNNQFDFDIARAVYTFLGPTQTLVHSLKYGNKPYISSTIAYSLAALWTKLGWTVDIVVPVPSSKKTLKERVADRLAVRKTAVRMPGPS